MRWGKRSKASSADVKESTQAIKNGPQERAHPDAISAKTQKARAKKSGLNALSNQDLEQLIKRQDLEQKYNKLNPTSMAKGQKIVNEAIANSMKNIAREEVDARSKKTVGFVKDNYQQLRDLM